MKNSDLFDVFEYNTKIEEEEEKRYYAKSRFNSWTGISRPDRQAAIDDGNCHAMVLKEAFPNLKGD